MIGKTSQEKTALIWLAGQTAECEHASVIQAMLFARSGPVMPEEPDDGALTALGAQYQGRIIAIDYYRALYAHLAAPATKEVEVWHVEHFDSINSEPRVDVVADSVIAEGRALALRSVHVRCIRITGPHKQTVPA